MSLENIIFNDVIQFTLNKKNVFSFDEGNLVPLCIKFKLSLLFIIYTIIRVLVYALHITAEKKHNSMK